MSTRSRLIGFLLTAFAGAGAARAQLAGNGTILPGVQGLRLQSVSVFGGYFTGGSPFAGQLPVTGALPREDMFGGSLAIAWSTERERSSLSVLYMPSIIGSTQMSSLNSVNHRLLVRASKTWNKWSLSLMAGGMTTVVQQQLFGTTPAGAITASGSSFDEFAAAALAGKSNAEIAALLTGAQLSAPPESSIFYGRRILTTRASAALSWAHSTRTSLSIEVSGLRNQHLNDSVIAGSTSSNPFLVPRTTEANVMISWNYSLTPRTNLSVDGGMSRIFSPLQAGYTTRTTVSIGRTMSRRWFLKGDAGVGVITYLRDQVVLPRRVQEVYGGNVGFKAAAHAFMGGYTRSAGDSYGLGSAATSGVVGAWTWRRPGASWESTVDAAYEQLSNTVYPKVKTWRAAVGISRMIGAHFAVSGNYGYYNVPRHLFAGVTGDHLGQQGVMLSLTWTPGFRP